MGNTDINHCENYNNSNENHFVANQISDKAMDYLSYFTNDNIDIEADHLISNESVGKACSHARNCQLRREGCSIHTCFHTYTCEFFCQNFIDNTQ